jgi:hypothetical protein
METHESLHRKWTKSMALAEDESAPAGERDAASKKAAGYRKRLDKLEGNADQKDQTNYLSAVARIRELLQQEGAIQCEIGDLVSQVETEYGKGTLQKLADELKIKLGTLQNYRTTALAWPEKSRRRDFSICAELNTHPQREGLLETHPDWTSRQARQKMLEYKEKQAEPKEQEEKPKRQKSPPIDHVAAAQETLEGILDRITSHLQKHLAYFKNHKIEDEQRASLRKLTSEVQKQFNIATAPIKSTTSSKERGAHK